MEQITASVEPQEVVISSNDANPAVSYAIGSSIQGSRVEVIIEDGSTNSSLGLCHNVEVLYSSGKYFQLTIVRLSDLLNFVEKTDIGFSHLQIFFLRSW